MTSSAGTSLGGIREGQPFVAGVYPLLLDETCFFLAVDFDKAGWQDDASAFLSACHRLRRPGGTGAISVRERAPCVVVL